MLSDNLQIGCNRAGLFIKLVEVLALVDGMILDILERCADAV